MIQLLQVPMQSVQNSLTQYGILGMFAFIMMWIIWYMEKLRKIREADIIVEKNELKARVLVLETRFSDYQLHDRKRMEDLIEKNIEVMEAVKTRLQSLKT